MLAVVPDMVVNEPKIIQEPSEVKKSLPSIEMKVESSIILE
jgi:hypothetical protein